MRILGIAAATTAAFAFCAQAAEVAPTAVAFSEGSVEQSLTGTAGDAANGRMIVGSKKFGNCVACHEVTDLKDIPFHGEIGPALDGTGSRWSEAELRGIVVNAKKMFEDTMMPSFYRTDGFLRPGKAYTGEPADDTFGPILTAQQIEDVVAYLVTLQE